MLTARIDVNANTLQDLIRLIKYKIQESKKFAVQFIPNYIHTPEDLFIFLKYKTSYMKDPKEFELLQSMQSLFEDNYHGVPGMGDCDCLTITGAASLYAIGSPYNLILAGNKSSPSHIFLKISGSNEYFDLTRNNFNELPRYKNYWQVP